MPFRNYTQLDSKALEAMTAAYDAAVPTATRTRTACTMSARRATPRPCCRRSRISRGGRNVCSAGSPARCRNDALPQLTRPHPTG